MKPVLFSLVLVSGLVFGTAGNVAAYDPTPDPRLSSGTSTSGKNAQADRNPRARWYENQARERSRSAGQSSYNSKRRRQD